MLWTLQAFFCNNIKSVLQSDYQIQALKARVQYMALHAFLWRLQVKLHVFNYTVTTYGYLSVQR